MGDAMELHFPEIPIRDAPVTHSSMPGVSISYDRLRFYGITNGICRRDEVCLTEDGYLMEELMCWTDASQHPSQDKPFLSPVTPYDGRVLALNIPSHQNYYHWTVDCLMAIYWCRKVGLEFDVLYFEQGRSFQGTTLELLGWSEYPVLDAAEFPAIQAKRLIVHNNKVPHPPTPFALEFLRKVYVPKVLGQTISGKLGRRIYFSRRLVSGRNLENEEEVINLMQSLDFEVICPEEMTIVEQAQVAYSASIICGVHGAALVNLIFARTGTKLVELVSPQYPDETYRRLAHLFNLDYRPYWAGEDVPPTPDYWTNNRAPLRVSTPNLKKFLTELL
jgi:capsular polysaccharide biosynthesis protein